MKVLVALGFAFLTGNSWASVGAEFNQRLGACNAATERAKRAQCFESLARDAVNELDKREAVEAAAPQPRVSKYADFISKAKANITRELKDSSSVQWRNTFVSDNKMPVLCGELNAKNSYGAYVGFRRFFATSEPMLQQIEDAKDPYVMEKMWPSMCSAKAEDVQ